MKKNNLINRLFIQTSNLTVILILIFVLLMVLMVSGCELSTMSLTGNTDSENNQNISEESSSNNLDNTSSITDSAGNDISQTESSLSSETSSAVEESTEASEETTQQDTNTEYTINVYYADEMGQYLVGETRIIPAQNKYVNALVELMQLPNNSNLHRLIPETTKINSVTVSSGVAKVDLSQNFENDRYSGDTSDILLIYSVVNTLTEFSEVNAVTFYIDGKKLDLFGQLDIKNPIYRKEELIAK